NPYSSSLQLFEDATGPQYLATVDGGSHLGPFTTDASEPDVARLAADFLRTYLGGDAAARARLGTDGDVDGEMALAASGARVGPGRPGSPSRPGGMLERAHPRLPPRRLRHLGHDRLPAACRFAADPGRRRARALAGSERARGAVGQRRAADHGRGVR